VKYRTLGHTDLKISEIGFGIWTVSTPYWGNTDERDNIYLVHGALDLGINFFDTADTYGLGYGEEFIAKALKHQRNNIVISTKFGHTLELNADSPQHGIQLKDFSGSNVRSACERSLRRLNTDYIDLYQLHNSCSADMYNDEIFETLDRLVNEGKIRYYGNVPGQEVLQPCNSDDLITNHGLASIQIKYNILDQKLARNVIQAASSKQIGVLCREPHASGILSSRYPDLANYIHQGVSHTAIELAGDNLYNNADLEEMLMRMDNMDKVGLISSLTEETNATIDQIALKFILSERSVASILPNITTTEQLEEYVSASNMPDLNSAMVKQIRELFDDTTLQTEDLNN
jgi:aryl-alcohol dehydrogenase-like predicted oxidoreductase